MKLDYFRMNFELEECILYLNLKAVLEYSQEKKTEEESRGSGAYHIIQNMKCYCQEGNYKTGQKKYKVGLKYFTEITQ